MKCVCLFRYLIIFGLLGSPGFIRAAESGPLLRFMSWETPITDLFLVVGKELKPLSIPAYNASNAVALQVGTFEVRLAKRIATAEGGLTTVVVAQATLPEGATGALIVLLPAAQAVEAMGPRLLVFPDSPTDFPAKSIRLINLSGNNSAVRIAKEDYSVPFGQSKVVPLAFDGLGRCLVTAAVLDSGNWTIVFKDMLAPAPTQRVTLLLAYSPTGAGTAMSFDEIQAGGKRFSTQFAIVLLDDVLGGKLLSRPAPEKGDRGGEVTEDRRRMKLD